MHITTLREKIDALPEDRRKRVEELADALIAEEMTLRDLRKARNQTQARVAQTLGINQENVSRIEQRSDLLISTLSGYVEAMGGKLHLVAEFPDRPPIALTGIAALDVTVQGGGPVLRQGGTIGRPSKTEIRASITRKPFLRIVEI